MFTPLQDLLPKAARKHGISQQLISADTCYQVQLIINKFFPVEQFRPKVNYLKNAKIFIGCQNSSQLHEASMLKNKILKQIKEGNLDKNIQEISFTLDLPS